jgi:hypothetical protein
MPICAFIGGYAEDMEGLGTAESCSYCHLRALFASASANLLRLWTLAPKFAESSRTGRACAMALYSSGWKRLHRVWGAMAGPPFRFPLRRTLSGRDCRIRGHVCWRLEGSRIVVRRNTLAFANNNSERFDPWVWCPSLLENNMLWLTAVAAKCELCANRTWGLAGSK